MRPDSRCINCCYCKTVGRGDFSICVSRPPQVVQTTEGQLSRFPRIQVPEEWVCGEFYDREEWIKEE
jgi:hypothetical protein